MNVLFLTLFDFDTIKLHNIYPDLLREFVKHGHNVYVISPIERRKKKSTYIINEEHVSILKLKILNYQKTNVIEKGISILTIEPQFISATKKYYSNIKFDLILYSTPPITFCNAIKYVKKRDNARTYLLLKDIFPQNSVDLEMLSTKSPIYKYFRLKEKELYKISDRIGCMSQANVEYVIKHNPEVNPNKVEVCPNSVEPIDLSIDDKKRKEIRLKYDLPLDKKIFIYGGNLGKPQGIDFMVECLKTQENNNKVFFLIIGEGTDSYKIENYINKNKPNNIRLMNKIPVNEYDTLVAACDIGMIFLDHRFTIPNCPSRMLTYMQAKLPILACTDISTDLRQVIEDNNIGWWCDSVNIEHFDNLINDLLNNEEVINNSWKVLFNNYYCGMSYEKILKIML